MAAQAATPAFSSAAVDFRAINLSPGTAHHVPVLNVYLLAAAEEVGAGGGGGGSDGEGCERGAGGGGGGSDGEGCERGAGLVQPSHPHWHICALACPFPLRTRH